jgi:UDP-N-acetyl-D-mannosaminuronate dehydrogenase
MAEKICVLGLGYVGLPTACMLAIQGYKVIGVDVNPEVIQIIAKGGIHIEEAGLKTILQAARNPHRRGGPEDDSSGGDKQHKSCRPHRG